MSAMMQGGVCVVIPAKDAALTIATAIRSALRESHVQEVVVVDDGSSDGTSQVAEAASDGSGRLTVIRLDKNRGPAFARNVAIANSTASLISVLDADDFFLKGRFGPLLGTDDWDFVADNVLFIPAGEPFGDADVPRFAAEPYFLDLKTFVLGNTITHGPSRSELGFLQPLMKRSFLDAHGLRYQDHLRLGEDYDLYARALAKGARFKVVHTCGYGAVVRPNSLSSQHTTADLKDFFEVDDAILSLGLSKENQDAVRRHQRAIRARYELRRFLEVKSSSGIGVAGLYGMRKPSALPAIVTGIARDKVRDFVARFRSKPPLQSPRFLLAGCVPDKS